MKTRFHWLVVMVALGVTGCAGQDVRLDWRPPIPGGRVGAEAEIEAILAEVQWGMQERRKARVLTHVSRSYRDPAGRSYQDLHAYLDQIFSRYRNIRIRRSRPRILVLGDFAHSIERFATTAEPTNPERDPHLETEGEVMAHFRREGGAWKITSWDLP